MTRSDFGSIIADSGPERLPEAGREDWLTMSTGTVRIFMIPVTLPS